MLLRAMIRLVFVYHSILPGLPLRSELGNQELLSHCSKQGRGIRSSPAGIPGGIRATAGGAVRSRGDGLLELPVSSLGDW
jgi:hypothetical protein